MTRFKMKILKTIILLTLTFILSLSEGQTLDDYGLEFHLKIDIIPLNIELDEYRIPIINIDSTGDTLLADIGVWFDIENYSDVSHEVTISDFKIINVLLYDNFYRMKYGGVIYPESYGILPPAGLDNNTRNMIFSKVETLFNEKKKKWTIYLRSQYSRNDIENLPKWVNYGTLYCLIVM